MTILELIEHIDTLVIKGAEPRDTKAQIATLHERVSALLSENENLKAEHATLKEENAKLKEANVLRQDAVDPLKRARAYSENEDVATG